MGSSCSSRAWIFEGEEQAHGNFPYIETQAVYSIKIPIGAIYIVEIDFLDRLPAYDSKEHRIDNICVIGAFRIKGENVVPANVFNTPNGKNYKILVESEGKLPRFQVDTTKKQIGIPLISAESFRFSGRYLDYIWDEEKECFIYSKPSN